MNFSRVQSIIILAVILGLLVFLGCEQHPVKINPERTKEFSKNLTFFKHEKSGLCFAITAVKTHATTDEQGIGLTEVDCAAVEDLLANKHW